MNEAMIASVVALLGQVIPVIGKNPALISNIINTLVTITPAVISEVQVLKPAIKNIVAALSANPATTAQQIATLKELDKVCDADFDDAANDPSDD
jgi:Glu-tRNA(Gln) amidotransferase subunit E-like FAD-binding protein